MSNWLLSPSGVVGVVGMTRRSHPFDSFLEIIGAEARVRVYDHMVEFQPAPRGLVEGSDFEGKCAVYSPAADPSTGIAINKNGRRLVAEVCGQVDGRRRLADAAFVRGHSDDR